MSKKQLCPTCGSALQEAAYKGETFYACTCGHGVAVRSITAVKGAVSYIQEVGNATLTQLILPKN